MFDELDHITGIMDGKGKVLIACEESQAVCIEFRNLGIEAYSCDIEPCSGNYPEWHLQEDVLPLLKLDWDLIIAFPPCTHLAISGAKWFSKKVKHGSQQKAIEFFMAFVHAKSRRVAIENPIGIMSNIYRKPDQIIHPWMFGHNEKKSTCIWLRNLPLLVPTDIVEASYESCFKMPETNNRAKLRSKTYLGIAKAMAYQWSPLL